MSLKSRGILFALLPVVIPVAIALLVGVVLPIQAQGHVPLFGRHDGGHGI